MIKLRDIVIASTALVFAGMAGAQTTDAAAVSATPATAATPATSATPATPATAAMPAASSDQSTDPYIQKRIEDTKAKAEYKQRKKVAKAEYKGEKKDAKSDLKAEKKESSEERKAKLATEPKSPATNQ